MPSYPQDMSVLVTGASSGIGLATARKYAEQGAQVALAARSVDHLNDVVDELKANGATAIAIPGDLTQAQAVEECVARTVGTFGGLDVLVTAAGIISTGTIESTSMDDWDLMMNLNVRSPFYLMQRAMPHLVERKGAVVNVSSVTGLRSFPGILSYCVSKAGVDQLTRCAALEMAPKGVRINAVNPGVVVTNLHRAGGMNDADYARFLEHSQSTHPMGRVGQPEEVADLIFFLASPEAGWITGVTCAIDGGRALTCFR